MLAAVTLVGVGVGCRHATVAERRCPDVPAAAVLSASRQSGPQSTPEDHSRERRRSLTCLSADEPVVRDKFRDVAAEYFAFRARFGDVLEAEWEAVQRELLFGTRVNRCVRLSALLDSLVEGMNRIEASDQQRRAATIGRAQGPDR